MTAGRERSGSEVAVTVAEAVRDGLHAAGVADVDALDVVPRLGAGTVELTTNFTGADVTLWADSVAEALGPLGTPRWMMVTSSGVAWRVPMAVGASKGPVESYAKAFAARVPAAKLVRAGTPQATVAVLDDRRSRPDDVKIGERWLGTLGR